MSAILDIRNLRIALPPGGDRPFAVDDANLTVHRGEVVCLVGESGSGKSVIAQAVMGLSAKELPVVAGEILLEGEDLRQASAARMRELRCVRMSMVFQEPMSALNPVMRCGDQLDEVLRTHTNWSAQERRSKVRRIIEEVHLPDPDRMIASYPHQLSGGQRQRVMIAMALIMEPALLIADEPTTALDVTIQGQILYEVQKLARETGTSLVWITHDLSVIAGLADRVCVMYAGRIVEQGTTAQVLGTPAHPYTQGLLDSVPSRNARGARLKQIPGMTPSLVDLPPGCAFRERCPRADALCGEAPAMTFAPGDPGRGARCHHPLVAWT